NKNCLGYMVLSRESFRILPVADGSVPLMFHARYWNSSHFTIGRKFRNLAFREFYAGPRGSGGCRPVGGRPSKAPFFVFLTRQFGFWPPLRAERAHSLRINPKPGFVARFAAMRSRYAQLETSLD